MRLTKRTLTKIIKEELMKENVRRALKIFEMLFPDGNLTESEEIYNQAVMLAAGANLLNEVVKMWEDKIRNMEKRGEKGGYYMGNNVFDQDWFRKSQIDPLVSKKEQFISDVEREMNA